jgi:hypothetical protein
MEGLGWAVLGGQVAGLKSRAEIFHGAGPHLKRGAVDELVWLGAWEGSKARSELQSQEQAFSWPDKLAWGKA